MLFISALVSGVIFGLGLILSGMTQPEKVIGFLNIFHNWDPSLLFVMIGAIIVSMVGFKLIKPHSTSLLNAPLRIPALQKIDRPLIIGAALFGTGWGLAGFCPGPALASLITLKEAAVFVSAMLFGILIFEVIQRIKQ